MIINQVIRLKSSNIFSSTLQIRVGLKKADRFNKKIIQYIISGSVVVVSDYSLLNSQTPLDKKKAEVHSLFYNSASPFNTAITTATAISTVATSITTTATAISTAYDALLLTICSLLNLEYDALKFIVMSYFHWLSSLAISLFDAQKSEHRILSRLSSGSPFLRGKYFDQFC